MIRALLARYGDAHPNVSKSAEKIDTSARHVDGVDMGQSVVSAEPVQITDTMALAFHRALTDGSIGQSEVDEIKVGLAAAFSCLTAACLDGYHKGKKDAARTAKDSSTVADDWQDFPRSVR